MQKSGNQQNVIFKARPGIGVPSNNLTFEKLIFILNLLVILQNLNQRIFFKFLLDF